MGDLKYYEAQVTDIDPQQNVIKCQDSTVNHFYPPFSLKPLQTLFATNEPPHTFTVDYDYLILAPGATPQVQFSFAVKIS